MGGVIFSRSKSHIKCSLENILVKQCFIYYKYRKQYTMHKRQLIRSAWYFCIIDTWERNNENIFSKNLEQINNYIFGQLAYQKMSGSQATSNIELFEEIF